MREITREGMRQGEVRRWKRRKKGKKREREREKGKRNIYDLARQTSSSMFFFQTCGNSITLDQPRLQHDNQVWHGTDKCFLCSYCRQSLVGQPFLPKYGRVFCGKDHAKKFKAKSKT